MPKHIGSIPSKVTYIYGSAYNMAVGSKYEEQIKRKAVLYTRVFDASVHSSIKSLPSMSNKKTLVMDNKPINDVTVIHNRYILVNGIYGVDVEADFMQDAIHNSTIKNGKIEGSFIWAAIGSSLKLVRIDSPLYKKIINFDRRKNLPKIKKKEFEVGGVYATPSGKAEIFLGKIDTDQDYLDYKTKVNSQISHRNKCLFYKVYNQGDYTIDFESLSPYKVGIKNNYSFVEKIAQVNLDKNIIAKIRSHYVDKMKQFIVDHSSNDAQKSWILGEYRYNSYLINVRLSGETLKDKFDINKYLTFM